MQVRKFEEAGLDRRPAEILCEHITEIVIANKAKMEETFVQNTLMQKASLGLNMLKAEV